ncbi:MAG: nitrous oxide reductase accessory protein NosL [Candidatus Polarisedimenticolaceae bacterium]|nr:nitrous oxide reductase accessory protein NosL [Candidatus Polarisedimenticolaceae bacterium]
MMPNSLLKTLSVLLLLLIFISGCSDNDTEESAGLPEDLTRSAVCLIDGMILADHPGPKGQAIFKDGQHHFFCDIKGLFSTLYDPNYKMKIKQAFVQDFGQREWGSYDDRWVDVESAFYVMDSKKFGAMGPTLVSYSKRTDADAFAKEFGGTVVAFSEITEELFEAYQARIRQQLRDAVGTGVSQHNH